MLYETLIFTPDFCVSFKYHLNFACIWCVCCACLLCLTRCVDIFH